MGAISDFCGDPIVVYDPHGNAVYANPAFERVFGWKADELLGKGIDFVPESALEETRKAISEVMAGKSVLGMETVRKTRFHKNIHVRLSAIPLFGEKDELKGIVVTLQDISDLVLSRHEAMAASKAKSDFLANISHEIRTPINGLMGMIDLIRHTRLDDEQQEYVEILHSKASLLMAVISDILDFSRLDANENETSHIRFNLHTSLETLVDIYKPKAESKGLSFILDLHREVPHFLIGDPEKLRQALTHLLDNAVKFTRQGEIRLCVMVLTQNPTHALLRFDIEDTGIGIEKEKQEMIFEAFSQADASSTRKYGGTGIGLTISKRLIQLMGGSLEVESRPGKGSRFSIPLEFEKQADPSFLIGAVPDTLKGKRILIVEDDAASRAILKEFAKSWGCSWDEAASKERALEKLSSTHSQEFDVALIHMQLEKNQGEVLAGHIRNTPQHSGMTVILLYSEGKKGDVERIQSVGVQGYLPKPVDADLLFACITTAMASKNNSPGVVITRHFLKEIQKQRSPVLLFEPSLVNRKIALGILTHSGYRVELAKTESQALTAFEKGCFNLVLMGNEQLIQPLREIEKKRGFKRGALLVMTEAADNLATEGVDEWIKKPLMAGHLISVIEKHNRLSLNHYTVKRISPDDIQIFNHGPALERAM